MANYNPRTDHLHTPQMKRKAVMKATEARRKKAKEGRRELTLTKLQYDTCKRLLAAEEAKTTVTRSCQHFYRTMPDQWRKQFRESLHPLIGLHQIIELGMSEYDSLSVSDGKWLIDLAGAFLPRETLGKAYTNLVNEMFSDEDDHNSVAIYLPSVEELDEMAMSELDALMKILEGEWNYE